MKVGITGTHRRLTTAQQDALYSRIAAFGIPSKMNGEFHHGDCINADAVGARFADLLGWKVHCHPPVNPRLRAFVKADVMYPEKEYLLRNQDIVNAVEVMVVVPSYPEHHEMSKRSGTWFTVRRARRKGIGVYYIWPDGSETTEGIPP